MCDEARLDFGYNWLPIGLSNKLHNSLVALKIIPKELLSQKIVKIRRLDDICILTFIVDEECSEKSESEEASEQQKQSDNNKSEKDITMCEN